MDLSQRGKLGRLCAACAAPLRARDRVCPRCGHEAGRPATLNSSLMTPFGWGFCGTIAGAVSGYAVLGAVVTPHRLLWVPLALAVLGAATAAAVGKRLDPQLRCSYEHLLLSFIFGSILSLFATLLGQVTLDTIGLIWLSGVAAAYLLLRRYGYKGD